MTTRTFPPMALAALVALFVAACGPTEHEVVRFEAKPVDGITERKVRVVTTTNFVTDLVEAVGGDRVTVDGLMGPGVDPHLYKATAGDVSRLSRADAVFQVGEDLEAKLGDVLDQAGERRVVVSVTDAMPEDDLLEPQSNAPAGEQHDPHVWFDPELWATTPAVVAEALGAIDPTHADEYEARAKEYADEVLATQETAREMLAPVPADKRLVVTSHDAFRYFGRAFDIEVQAIQGISTASEATTSDIDRIADLLVKRKVASVFVESSVSRRTIDAVVAAAADQDWKVEIGTELFSDAAGDPGTPEASWSGMLLHNVTSIREGLT
ncbi:MAG: periplasmic solute binding protein [Thermoleophilia bacterium]|nr:periplasmic solute binding protein [Thermoleophilia bacterium]